MMRATVKVSGEQFVERVMPLMVRLFCLPGEQRTGALAALLGGVEERFESFESLSRDEFLALFQWTLDNEEREESCADAKPRRAGESL
jgi:hypothetical protein